MGLVYVRVVPLILTGVEAIESFALGWREKVNAIYLTLVPRYWEAVKEQSSAGINPGE